MKIKLLYGRAGDGFADAAGSIIDVPTDEAQRYVEDGQAELVGKEPKATKKVAAAKPSDKAEKRG